MKTTLRFWAAIAVTAGLFAGCSDLEDYKNKVDELDGRVTALETITTNLNKNIEALQTLYSGATINSATKDANNVWTIVLSNGETLTLNQGSVGVANAPVMSVDKDGYWMVDYDGNGGNAPEYIKNGEDKVLVVINMRDTQHHIELPEQWKGRVCKNVVTGETVTLSSGADLLRPFEYYVVK